MDINILSSGFIAIISTQQSTQSLINYLNSLMDISILYIHHTPPSYNIQGRSKNSTLLVVSFIFLFSLRVG